MTKIKIIPTFYSRDKKPTLRLLLTLTAVAAVIVALLIALGGEKYSAAVGITVAVYSLCAAVALFRAFRQQLQYSPYSYNTIFYIGFALFALSVLSEFAVLSVLMLKAPGVYQGFTLIHTLLASAHNFMFYTFPFIFIFSLMLCISNISLIRHEGWRPVNLLGIILSFILVGGFMLLYFFNYYASGSETEVMIHDLFTNLFAAIYLYFECMMIGTVISSAITSRYEPEKNMDFIIILGCSLRKDGTPTPLLKSRIDRAVKFYEEQKQLTGKEAVFVTSGGQGTDEAVAESASMKRYLTEKGISPERIIEEDKSTNTLENMKFSKEKISAINPNAEIAFSTNKYHVFRSGLLAAGIDMRVTGIGASTKWYFWPNAAVREFAGLISKQKGRQLTILALMIVFYAVLTVIAYQLF